MSYRGQSWYLNQTYTQRKKRVVKDSSGKPVLDKYKNNTYTVTTALLPNCLVEPRLAYGSENTAGQEHVGAGLDLYCADPEADIAPTDQFQVDGVWWEVDGPVRRYRNSRLGNDFCHVNLERITG